jgi:hypothetical protein
MKDKTVRALTYVRNMKRTQIWLVNLERYHMGDWHNMELKTVVKIETGLSWLLSGL